MATSVMHRLKNARQWVRQAPLLIKMTAALLLGAVVVRQILFGYGLFYTAAEARGAAIVIVGLVATLGVEWCRWRAGGSGAMKMFESAALFVTLLSAVWVVASWLFPSAKPYVAAPACEGVPLAGAPFLAQTRDSESHGLNARSGAGTAYPQVNRFPSGCTLGFDGFCVGGAVNEKAAGGLPDTRWLIVHRRHYLVSAAYVVDQSAVSKLGRGEHKDCEKMYGGVGLPGAPRFLPMAHADGTVSLQIKASSKPVLAGYAVRVSRPGLYPYSPIGSPLTNSPAFKGTWNASTTVTPLLRSGRGVAQVAAAYCLGPDAVAGRADVYDATFNAGKIELRPWTKSDRARHPDIVDRLGRTACSGI